MTDLFTLAHYPITSDSVDPDMPRNGDAVIVLRSDGSTGMFTLGIDGATLVSLMIDFNLGVSVETSYDYKRVDSDFFAEE